MFLAAVIVMVIAACFLDAPSLVRQHAYKDLVVFIVFLLAAVYVAMVQLYDWPFYNPLLAIAEQLHSP